MIVFSNTTPLIALAGINRLDLLQAVFGRIAETSRLNAASKKSGPSPYIYAAS